MLMRGSVSPVALIGVLCTTLNGAWALDETKYPDWKGQWVRADSAEIAPWDSRKPWGLGRQLPLTPEYQAIFEASHKQLAASAPHTHPGCDAAHDDANPFDGDRHHAGHALHHDRDLLDAAPHLRRQAGADRGRRKIDRAEAAGRLRLPCLAQAEVEMNAAVTISPKDRRRRT